MRYRRAALTASQPGQRAPDRYAGSSSLSLRKMLGLYSMPSQVDAIPSPLCSDGLSDPFYQRLKESVAQGCRVVCGRPAAFSSYDRKAADPRQDQALALRYELHAMRDYHQDDRSEVSGAASTFTSTPARVATSENFDSPSLLQSAACAGGNGRKSAGPTGIRPAA